MCHFVPLSSVVSYSLYFLRFNSKSLQIVAGRFPLNKELAFELAALMAQVAYLIINPIITTSSSSSPSTSSSSSSSTSSLPPSLQLACLWVGRPYGSGWSLDHQSHHYHHHRHQHHHHRRHQRHHYHHHCNLLAFELAALMAQVLILDVHIIIFTNMIGTNHYHHLDYRLTWATSVLNVVAVRQWETQISRKLSRDSTQFAILLRWIVSMIIIAIIT